MIKPAAVTADTNSHNKSRQANVAIAGCNQLFTIGIKTVIENHPFTTFVASFLDELTVFDWYDGSNADIIIIDLNTFAQDVIKTIIQWLGRFPNSKIIALANYNDPTIIKQLADAGVSAHVLKDIGPDELIQTILTVHCGEKVFPLTIAEKFPNETLAKNEIPAGLLTVREIEILKLMVLGKKSKLIAAELNISTLTVKKHRENILRKIGATNTVQIILAINFEAFFKAHKER
jgi:DNA-binding NarL/FixJ family response regulator